MKKLLLLLALLPLVSFTPQVNKVYKAAGDDYSTIYFKTIVADGMRYGVFYKDHSYSNPTVVNFTLDKAQTVYYQQHKY